MHQYPLAQATCQSESGGWSLAVAKPLPHVQKKEKGPTYVGPLVAVGALGVSRRAWVCCPAKSICISNCELTALKQNFVAL